MAGIGGLHGARGLLARAYPHLPGVDAEGRRSNARMVEDELRREQHALTGRAKEIEGTLGTRPRAEIAAGDPASSLLRAAEKGAAEQTLIVVGSRDSQKLDFWRLFTNPLQTTHQGLPSVYKPR